MMDIAPAIYAKLAASAAVTTRVSAYRSLPAIFTSSPVPVDALRPFVVSAGDISSVPDDCYGGPLGYEIVRDVGCYADANGSSLTINALASAVRAALHRQRLILAGATHIMTVCTNIVVAPSDETIVGRILTFRIRVREL